MAMFIRMKIEFNVQNICSLTGCTGCNHGVRFPSSIHNSQLYIWVVENCTRKKCYCLNDHIFYTKYTLLLDSKSSMIPLSFMIVNNGHILYKLLETILIICLKMYPEVYMHIDMYINLYMIYT